MKTKLRVYVAVKMTGRYQDELVKEALIVKRTLENNGFEVLHPVIEEQVQPVHEILGQTDPKKLERYWTRDKECLKECHMVLDYKSCNKSDGVGVELALSRFCYFKPTIRVFPDAGICISKIEYDEVYDRLEDAVKQMKRKYGTRRKLLVWRIRMLMRSLPHWIGLQIKFIGDLL